MVKKLFFAALAMLAVAVSNPQPAQARAGWDKGDIIDIVNSAIAQLRDNRCKGADVTRPCIPSGTDVTFGSDDGPVQYLFRGGNGFVSPLNRDEIAIEEGFLIGGGVEVYRRTVYSADSDTTRVKQGVYYVLSGAVSGGPTFLDTEWRSGLYNVSGQQVRYITRSRPGNATAHRALEALQQYRNSEKRAPDKPRMHNRW